MSDLPVVAVNNPRVVTTVSAIAGAHSDHRITSVSETDAHTDYVPLGAAECTPDVNYACLVRDTNSTPDNINTAHQVTASTNNRSNNYTEPFYHDSAYTQSATYDNKVVSSATYDNKVLSHYNTTEPSSYDNNSAASVVQQQQTVCGPL
jgi:hypothetical protein